MTPAMPTISKVFTTRRICGIAAQSTTPNPTVGHIADNECDTNAATCCLGANFSILAHTRRTADVYACDQSIATIEGVPIVSGATAWTDPGTTQTYILIVNEALYYGPKLDHSLLNPNQIRRFGIPFWDSPFDTARGLQIDIEPVVPLTTKGTKIFFKSRVPTKFELENCPHIQLTSKCCWNPGTILLSEINQKDSNTIYDNRTDKGFNPLHDLQERLLRVTPTISKVSRAFMITH